MMILRTLYLFALLTLMLWAGTLAFLVVQL